MLSLKVAHRTVRARLVFHQNRGRFSAWVTWKIETPAVYTVLSIIDSMIISESQRNKIMSMPCKQNSQIQVLFRLLAFTDEQRYSYSERRKPYLPALIITIWAKTLEQLYEFKGLPWRYLEMSTRTGTWIGH